jgi:transposase-like protein
MPEQAFAFPSGGEGTVRGMERTWLQGLLAEGYSLERIGRLTGKHHSTVGYWIRKHGLVAAHREKFAPKGGVGEDTLRRLVERGLSVRAIAHELELSIATTRYWLQRFDLHTQQSFRDQTYRDARVAALAEIDMTCRRHGRTTFRRQASGRYKCSRCVSRDVAQRRRRVKETLVREAGGRCHVCGYDRYQGALQFHHVERGQKAFAVGHDGTTRSLERLRDEIRKCILLCGNCHAEVEAGVTALTSVPLVRARSPGDK